MSIFGTDGVRGVANEELTPEFALKLGKIVGSWIRTNNHKKVVIGRDTRKSGTMLGAALASGFASVGVNVSTLGIVPTPTISHAVRTGDFFAGAVISASHNPPQDNGIKFFGSNGGKLSTEVEKFFEQQIENYETPGSSEIGIIQPDETLVTNYISWLTNLFSIELSSLTIALDCANGAAFNIAPLLFQSLGATIVCTGVDSSGENINFNCGATHPEAIKSLTLKSRADLGVSFDGDADRCIFVDEKGNLINGDRFMASWAAFEKKSNRLNPNKLVGTVMSNMGFETSLKNLGISLERVSVGDRNVSEKLSELNAKIGGEQSGHIIFPDYSPTGDGILTALQMVRLIVDSNCKASELPPHFNNWPQILINVSLPDKNQWKQMSNIQEEIRNASNSLEGIGRVVVRASGTQPMVRIMVEATTEEVRDQHANRILEAFIQHAGATLKNRTDLTHALGD